MLDWSRCALVIIDHYLGAKWKRHQAQDWATLQFRLGRRNEKELPVEFFWRATSLYRIVYGSPITADLTPEEYNALDQEELYEILSKIPEEWAHMLNPISCKTMFDLDRKAQFLEDSLLSAFRVPLTDCNNNRNDSSRSSDTRNYGYRRNAQQANVDEAHEADSDHHHHYHNDHDHDHEDTLGTSSAHAVESKPAPSSSGQPSRFRPFNKNPRKIVFTPGCTPYTRHDEVHTRSKPRRPCRLCGSPNHYNPDCPDYPHMMANRKANPEEGYVSDNEENEAYLATCFSNESDVDAYFSESSVTELPETNLGPYVFFAEHELPTIEEEMGLSTEACCFMTETVLDVPSTLSETPEEEAELLSSP
jgi:hypothetical protein